MNRVILVPTTEAHHFPEMTVIATAGSLSALLGESSKERSRGAYESEEKFFDAVCSGRADLNTFETDEEAEAFAIGKIEFLTEKARQIEQAAHQTSPLPPKKIAEADTARTALADTA